MRLFPLMKLCSSAKHQGKVSYVMNVSEEDALKLLAASGKHGGVRKRRKARHLITDEIEKYRYSLNSMLQPTEWYICCLADVIQYGGANNKTEVEGVKEIPDVKLATQRREPSNPNHRCSKAEKV
ncbi:hypothetical protein VNO77_00036 [Canavalia gladiata]|uniref:Uncharacterized protein n=1 Tax=Canavalia gladiata TaxID=3824 RepID=A0AAN9R102_CANGL